MKTGEKMTIIGPLVIFVNLARLIQCATFTPVKHANDSVYTNVVQVHSIMPAEPRPMPPWYEQVLIPACGHTMRQAATLLRANWRKPLLDYAAFTDSPLPSSTDHRVKWKEEYDRLIANMEDGLTTHSTDRCGRFPSLPLIGVRKRRPLCEVTLAILQACRNFSAITPHHVDSVLVPYERHARGKTAAGRHRRHSRGRFQRHRSRDVHASTPKTPPTSKNEC